MANATNWSFLSFLHVPPPIPASWLLNLYWQAADQDPMKPDLTLPLSLSPSLFLLNLRRQPCSCPPPQPRALGARSHVGLPRHGRTECAAYSAAVTSEQINKLKGYPKKPHELSKCKTKNNMRSLLVNKNYAGLLTIWKPYRLKCNPNSPFPEACPGC